MHTKIRYSVLETLRRHYLTGVASLLVLGACVWGMYDGYQLATNGSTALYPSFALSAAAPVTLSIPRLDLQTHFSDPLGTEPDGAIAVPNDYDSVGYYKHGPTPGELGPAVVLGHVDSIDGPAVFYSLGQLTRGDMIYITRADGSIALFEVEALEHPSQDSFPTSRVYGDLDYAGLRLITCSGRFDQGKQRYSHNLIVYARLVDVPPVHDNVLLF